MHQAIQRAFGLNGQDDHEASQNADSEKNQEGDDERAQMLTPIVFRDTARREREHASVLRAEALIVQLLPRGSRETELLASNLL